MADEMDFCPLVHFGRERRDLDYKGATAWDTSDKAACCAIVKDILAMANTLGGSIIVGVDESTSGFVASGLSPDQLRTWESTRVNNFVQSYADPPVSVEIAMPVCDGNQFVVVLVPQFRAVPHICVKDYPGVLSKPTLYVRTANNASEPIATSHDFQDVVEQAVRTRQDQMLESMRAILTGAAVTSQPIDRERFEEQAAGVRATFEDSYPGKDYDGYFTSEIFPARFDPARFSLEDLRRAAADASVSHRGWPFVYYQVGDPHLAVMNDGIRFEFVDTDFRGEDLYVRWDLKQSGLFIQRSLFREESPGVRQEYGRVIDPNAIIFYVAEAIDALVRLYTALGVEDEDVTLRVVLSGTRDRELQVVGSRASRLRGGYVARETEIPVDGTHPLAEWRSNLREFATMMAWEILQRFQVTGGFAIREWVDKLLDRRL